MRRGSNKIDEERVCIDALVQYLTGVEASSLIETRKEPDDPPDYWLKVGEHRFAVEITSIVDDQGYAALCSALHDSIKTQVESDGPAPGTFAVEFFRRPDLPRRGTREWKNLVAGAATRIKDLAGSAPGSKSRVLQYTGGHITVSKWSIEGSAVGMCRTPASRAVRSLSVPARSAPSTWPSR